MVQGTESVLSILDEFYTPFSKSQCRHCKYLIDGHCDMTCQKHPRGIPADFWNNQEECPHRQGEK